MSGKGEKAEKAGGSRMLKKARSFREDFKGLIRRRPSNSSQHGLPAGKPKMASGRASSMGAERDPDLEKLQSAVDNVNRSLTYLKQVVNQDKLQMVPKTATVILDMVNDVFTILNSFFMNQESSTLSSRHKMVCQSLAHFIKWADDMLIHGNKMLNKDNAHKLISALSDGIEELTQICIDKWEDRHNTQSSPQKSPAPLSPNTPKRSSLPDIPLTPRECEILEKTRDLGIYDNPMIPASKSSDSVATSNGNTFDFSQLTQSTPPPKPPLPLNADILIPQLIQKSLSQTDEVDGGDMPPPLPDKTKRRSQIQNMLEMVSNAGFHGSGLSSSNQSSPHNSMAFSANTLDCSMNSSNGSLQSQGSFPSPTNSVGSDLNLNHSADDLMGRQRDQHVQSFSKTLSDSKLVKKSTVISGSHSECTVHQINQLTQEIDKLTKLTADMEAMTRKSLGGKSDGDNRPAPGVPPIPNKANRMNRMVSHYDNVPDGTSLEASFANFSNLCNRTVISRTITSRTSQTSQCSESRLSSSSTSSTQSFSGMQMQKSNTIAFSHQTSSQEDAYSSSGSFSSTSHSSVDSIPKPPPLPPKQRHIQAYMQTFGEYTQPQTTEFYSRHSINFYESQWQRHQMELSHTMYPRSNTFSVISDISSESSFGGSAPGSPSIPALPAKRRFGTNRDSQLSTTSSQLEVPVDMGRDQKTISLIEPTVEKQPDVEQKRASAPAGHATEAPAPVEPVESPVKPDIPKDADSDFAELNPLDDIDVSDQLIYKKKEEEGPDIRGGSIDALIVHAAAAVKSGSHSDLANQEEFMYQEAFLTTYRTIITSRELIDKLLYRFNKFQMSQDINKKKVARNSFSLLIRVIDLMSCVELDQSVISLMMGLVFELLCQGDLSLARVLRRKLIEKCENKIHQQQLAAHVKLLSSESVMTNPPSLLSFKSHEIAEQMTLVDADLFQRIEIHEVLLWAKEQSEELSPNLTEFTEHFNKVSYWVRTRILLQNEAKEREKYMTKFLKIMKVLRKMSNFNSYLAILAALDSASIRRLDWPKQDLEHLKEFAQLIDNYLSFRALRTAIAETEPPCIPYIGLILQDLTFTNYGNPDLLPDGSINFMKCWLQFHILDSMRRFRDKKCSYDIKRNERILSMFDNFNDYLGEETLWQISEEIKPRTSK